MPFTNKYSTSNGILFGLPKVSSIRASQTSLLPFPQLPLGAHQSNILPDLGNRNLISIGQLCDNCFSEIFTTKDVSLIVPNTTLTGTRNTDNVIYYMDLQSIELSPVTHIPQHSPLSNNIHTLSTNSEIVQYIHQSDFSPVVSTWTATINPGFFITRPGLTYLSGRLG